jgi:hypothetical protein
VVTSEEPLLRGSAELRRFLHRYVDGPTTYSWEWDRYDVSTAGPLAWLLAEGTETATSGDHVERHRYRMTMVLERHRDHWLVRQVHGSVAALSGNDACLVADPSAVMKELRPAVQPSLPS